ncbi:helix-turn-helix domain-containing protein [Rummeliibacillus stabekisii]|uniref:helix-turn-helix domain-containing protein n=1 Tax=Rummeliibacillus stabekisii TaxID=241244 RepID=UPI00203DBF7D|nr:helix-turn-helix domain-containing protein [Rummeliibacillus stabekisii]MCM3316693.1 helix-turn-helix domain-containing protein [Rummeliibacillus stabekisii]
MAAFDYLKQYINFSSVEEMDVEVEKHIQSHYYDLTASERAIVFKLAAHALEYPGVTHLKASTIAAALEISTKTVYRAIKKLESLGIIKKENTVKSKGGQGANIFIILKHNVPAEMSERENDEKPCESKGEEEVSENQSSKSFNLLKQALKNNNIYSNVANKPVSKESKEQKIKQYGNDYQQSLYNMIRMMPFAESIVNAAYEISLALSMKTKEDFILAKDTIKKVSMDMLSHLRVSSTVRALVEASYYRAKKRRDSHSNLVRCNWLTMKRRGTVVEEKASVKPSFDVTKYNWLGN